MWGWRKVVEAAAAAAAGGGAGGATNPPWSRSECQEDACEVSEAGDCE